MRSAERLLAVLKAFRKGAAKRSLTEISKELELSPTTVKRLLMTLEKYGFVRMDAKGSHYTLDHELIRLASVALSGSSLVQVATGNLDALNNTLNESVQLTIRDGGDLIVIDSRQSQHLLQAFHTVGHRYPAYRGSAAGQVLLAHLDADTLSEVLPTEQSWESTLDKPPVKRAEFLSLLETVRGQGYAINDGSTDPNIWAVAAPIIDQQKHAIAAINVPVPASRADTDSRRQELTEAVVNAARGVSEAIFFAL